ncbi:MAG: hypothetical protein NDF54_10055 [archaeon GB-1867-035]|nr:hypothetical protein [Candidatus Culexmicrobium profundum]
MNINSHKYIKAIMESIDKYIIDNLSVLRARDLYEFYRALFHELKEFFGGSWGFEGVTEILIFRVLHHIINDDVEVIDITGDLKAFYYKRRNLVLGAGLPLMINNKKIWPDIIIYEPKRSNPTKIAKLKSVIEIKAYPQGGLKAIKKEIKRLINIHNTYHNPKSALIIYTIHAKIKRRSKIWKYLNRMLKDEEIIPSYIDVLLLDECNDKIIELFKQYTFT